LYNNTSYFLILFFNVLFDSSNDKALEDDEIKEVIKDYKRYMTQNNILGGATI